MKVKIIKHYNKLEIGKVFDLGEPVSSVVGETSKVLVFKPFLFKAHTYIPWLHIFAKTDMVLNFMNEKGLIIISFKEVEEVK